MKSSYLNHFIGIPYFLSKCILTIDNPDSTLRCVFLLLGLADMLCNAQNIYEKIFSEVLVLYIFGIWSMHICAHMCVCMHVCVYVP